MTDLRGVEYSKDLNPDISANTLNSLLFQMENDITTFFISLIWFEAHIQQFLRSKIM